MTTLSSMSIIMTMKLLITKLSLKGQSGLLKCFSYIVTFQTSVNYNSHTMTVCNDKVLIIIFIILVPMY